MFAALMIAAALPASADVYPISPVRVRLRIEPDRMVADIQADSVFWIEEILGLNPLPPSDWPRETLRKAEDYAETHLRLNVDGRRIRGRLAGASYAQSPWQVHEQGRIFLRMVYPPVAAGAALAGEIDFYEEHRRDMLESLKGEPLPYAEGYKTLLRAGSRRFELKPGASSFELPERTARPGAVARVLIALAAGARGVPATPAAWPALAALALSLAPGAPSKRRVAAGLLALSAGLAAAPRAAPSGAAVWIAGLAAATAAGGWLGAALSPILASLSLVALGLVWGAGTLPWLPAAAPGAALRAAAAAGTTAAAAAAVAALSAAVAAERRRLAALSESHAAELFTRRRRLAATLLALVCGYGLSQNLPW